MNNRKNIKSVTIILIVFCMICTSLLFNGVTTIATNADEISVLVNNVPVAFDQQPIIENGRTLVPMRAIFEAMGATIEWNDSTKTVTAVKDGITIEITIGSYTAIKDGNQFALDVPAKIVNGRTLVPVRFVAESLEAEVNWDEKVRTVIITYNNLSKYIYISNIKIAINDTIANVVSQLGEADRIDESAYDFKWHIYNSDYSRFIMVGIDDNGIVKGLYTNSKGFETNNAKYGDTQEHKTDDYTTFYYDKLKASVYLEATVFKESDVATIHAVLIAPKLGRNIPEHSESVKRAEEMQNFDAVNAFRVNYGLEPLLFDDTAAITARKHSQDMADRNYFNHTNLDGLSPWDRYDNNGGREYISAGENISAGRAFGIDAFDGWVNSSGHRNNMLGKNFTHLGVGMGYNTNSQYQYYFTQFFFTLWER